MPRSTPLFLTKDQAASEFGLAPEDAERVVDGLPEVGVYLTQSNPLYATADIKKKMKEMGYE